MHNGKLAGEGDIFYDNQKDQYYIGVSSGELVPLNSNYSPSSVVLNKSGGSLPTSNNTYFDFPINATNIQSIDATTFQVIGNGEIRVLKSGVYSIVAGISCTNMPSGASKFIIGMTVNGALRGYISRGFANLPSNDFWGTSGAMMYSLNANDRVTIRYVLNAGITLNAAYMNIGMSKL